jgi:predicted amidophosphoribosyltransferase
MKNNILRQFIDLLFPVACLDCGNEGKWLCQNCFNKLEFSNAQVCLNCKKISENGRFCEKCSDEFSLQAVLIAADYNNRIISDLVKNLKYHFAQDIAEILGNFLTVFIENGD